jgi:2-oxoglutarate ferredoxin oxidoreductase subunit beta
MAKTFQRPRAMFDAHTHYCPGCTHGVIHRLVAETIDELASGPARWASRRWAAR